MLYLLNYIYFENETRKNETFSISVNNVLFQIYIFFAYYLNRVLLYHKSTAQIVWLISLFNGISTLFRLLNAKAVLLEEQK